MRIKIKKRESVPDNPAVTKAVSFLDQKQIPLMDRPDIQKSSYHILPSNLPNISSEQLSRRYSAAVSMQSYVNEQLALVTVTVAGLRSELKFLEAELTINSSRRSSNTKKYVSDAMRYHDDKWREIAMRLSIEEAKEHLLQASFHKYENMAKALSREISRRESQFNTGNRNF